MLRIYFFIFGSCEPSNYLFCSGWSKSANRFGCYKNLEYHQQLRLIAAKCVVMHITRSHRPISVSYHMGDTRFETISTHKHLGIVLSANLEWGSHVDEITSKAKRLLGFIRRTVGSNDPVTIGKLFVALVRPIIEYCAPLWAPNRESHKHKLEEVQRSFTRYCFPGPWQSWPSYNTTRLRSLDISHHYFPLWLSSYHVCCWVFLRQVWYHLGGSHDQGKYI